MTYSHPGTRGGQTTPHVRLRKGRVVATLTAEQTLAGVERSLLRYREELLMARKMGWGSGVVLEPLIEKYEREIHEMKAELADAHNS